MKANKTIDFLTVTLFFGVIFSFMIYLGLSAMLDLEEDLELNENEGFNSSFYEDEMINEFVTICDYKLFGHINHSDIIIGEQEWLFEAIDSQNGYERLLDYVGGCTFNDKQLARIGAEINSRRAYYNEQGADYMLVVIPDSITVCSDKVPGYLGTQSDSTRLRALRAYLEGAGESAFVDPSDVLKGSVSFPTYNNTENSINSYGAYCVYDTVMSRYSQNKDIDRIDYEELEFFTRLTDGKAIALRAGLDKTIKNRTVSLSDSMPESYVVLSNEKNLVITKHDSRTNGDSVIVECADEWDRIQLTPYFSNTFDMVYYSNSQALTADAVNKYNVSLVVQTIHESELAKLLG